jgi:small acid-soluble spore protein H (minor)
MRAERASEILKSPDTIEVLYNNTPVWIDSVDENSRTAGIRLLETGSSLQVPVDELKEAGRSALS